jgi:hypothetical protein
MQFAQFPENRIVGAMEDLESGPAEEAAEEAFHGRNSV